MTANAATPDRSVATHITSTPRIFGPPSPMNFATALYPDFQCSDFEIDHLGHDEAADRHPDEPTTASHHQALVDEELLHIAAVDEPDHDEHDERKRSDDIGRSLGFGRHRLDLEFHLS